MLKFFQILLAGMLIHFAVIAFRTPVHISGSTVARSSSKNITQLKEDHFLHFSVFSASAIKASIFRIRRLKHALGASNFSAIISSESRTFVSGHLVAARASLRATHAFHDSSLREMVLVKHDLIALLKIEIRIWDSLLSSFDMPLLAGVNHSSQFDLHLHAYSQASANLSKTFLRILHSTNT